MAGVTRRRVFHKTLKRDAVEQVTAGGLSSRAVAAKLDIHETVLRRWIHKFSTEQKAGSPDDKASPPVSFDSPNAELLAENALLRREIERLRADRKVLKKALAMAFEELT